METPISPEQQGPTEAPKPPLSETQQVAAPVKDLAVGETAPIGNRGWRIQQLNNSSSLGDTSVRGFEANSSDGKNVLHIILRPKETPGVWSLDIANSIIRGKTRGGRTWGEIPPMREITLTQAELRDALRYITITFPDIEQVENFREAVGHRRTFQSIPLARFRTGKQVLPAPAARAAEATPAPAKTSLSARIKSLFQQREKD